MGDVMSTSVRSVRKECSIKDVAIAMTGDVTGLVPVVDCAERFGSDNRTRHCHPRVRR